MEKILKKKYLVGNLTNVLYAKIKYYNKKISNLFSSQNVKLFFDDPILKFKKNLRLGDFHGW
jgi:hypothetical protein